MWLTTGYFAFLRHEANFAFLISKYPRRPFILSQAPKTASKFSLVFKTRATVRECVSILKKEREKKKKQKKDIKTTKTWESLSTQVIKWKKWCLGKLILQKCSLWENSRTQGKQGKEERKSDSSSIWQLKQAECSPITGCSSRNDVTVKFDFPKEKVE